MINKYQVTFSGGRPSGGNILQLQEQLSQLATRFSIAKKLQQTITDPFRTGLRTSMTKKELIIQRLVIILNSVNQKIGLQDKNFEITNDQQKLILYGLYQSHRICQELFFTNINPKTRTATNYLDSNHLRVILTTLGIKQEILTINNRDGWNFNLNQYMTQVDSEMVGRVFEIVELALRIIVNESQTKQYETFTQYVSKYYLYTLLAQKIMQINYSENALTIEYVFLDNMRNAIRYLLRQIIGILIAFVLISAHHFKNYGLRIQQQIQKAVENQPDKKKVLNWSHDIQYNYNDLAHNMGLLRFRRRLIWINNQWRAAQDLKALKETQTQWNQQTQAKYRDVIKKQDQNIFAENYQKNNQKLSYLQKVEAPSVSKNSSHGKTNLLRQLTVQARDGILKKYQRMTVIASKLYLDFMKGIEGSMVRSKQKEQIYNQKYRRAKIYLMSMHNIASMPSAKTNSHQKILMYLERAKSLAFQLRTQVADIDLKAIQLNDRIASLPTAQYFISIFKIDRDKYLKLSEMSLQTLINQVQSSSRQGLQYARSGWNIVIPRIFMDTPLNGPTYFWSFDEFDQTYLGQMKKKLDDIKDLQLRFPKIYSYVKDNLSAQFKNKNIARGTDQKLLMDQYFKFILQRPDPSLITNPYYKQQLDVLQKEVGFKSQFGHPQKLTVQQHELYKNWYEGTQGIVIPPKSKYLTHESLNLWSHFLEKYYTNINTDQRIQALNKALTHRGQQIGQLEEAMSLLTSEINDKKVQNNSRLIDLTNLQQILDNQKNKYQQLKTYAESLQEKKKLQGDMQLKAQDIFEKFSDQFIWQKLGKQKSRELFQMFLMQTNNIQKGVQAFFRFTRTDEDGRETMIRDMISSLNNQEAMNKQLKMYQIARKSTTTKLFDSVYEIMKQTGVFQTLQSLKYRKQILENTIKLYNDQLNSNGFLQQRLGYSQTLRNLTKSKQQIEANQQKLWERIMPLKSFLKRNYLQTIVSSQPQKNKAQLAKKLMPQQSDIQSVQTVDENLLSNMRKQFLLWKRKALLETKNDVRIEIFKESQALINQIRQSMEQEHSRAVTDVEIMIQVLKKYKDNAKRQKERQSSMTMEKAQIRCLISNAAKNVQILQRSYIEMEQILEAIGRIVFDRLDQESVQQCLAVIDILKENSRIISQASFTEIIRNCFVLEGFTDHKKIIQHIDVNQLISKSDLTKLKQRLSYFKGLQFKKINVTDYL